ncbi:MAG: STAS domain-containing protein [Spirochaetales bacterium]|jgi:anti-sigma B factor antagonist|nr:STAS domain-containing protein [Spirochaetales bacterium]MCR5443451.1 STAS domain-containing protein [Sphaerochaetaceae bacterium]MBQ3317965.1 STAS domain-containing protein [Spirochaetales bacterium]MBQ3697713.1 STAS domain-containing protein [Spirochaetales bacterium]MBQ3728162.1 STAS domain-containing protein [Spirochaetales bacterium]
MEFKKVKEGSKLTYTVSGRLDTNTSPELNDDIAASLGDVKELVMDIKDLEYISSAGVRVLLSAYKVMKKQGTMVLKNVPEIVRNVLSVTGLLDFFTIE